MEKTIRLREDEAEILARYRGWKAGGKGGQQIERALSERAGTH